MVKAFIYCRYSTQRQVLSPAIQTADCKRYFDWKLQGKAELVPEAFVDDALSGKINFLDRPAGGKLDKVLNRGDHVLISKLDRGFRNPRDLLAMLELWKSRGVNLHLLDINADCSDPIGELIVTIMAAVAKWERIRIAERCGAGVKLAYERKRARGFPTGNAPAGLKWAGVRPNRYWVIDHEERERMAEALALYEEWRPSHTEQYTYTLISWHFRRLHGAKRISKLRFFGNTEGVRRIVANERRFQAWEAEGRSEEWICKTVQIDRMKANGYVIPEKLLKAVNA